MKHNIDAIYVEKNIYGNLIGTLLNIPSKIKDGVKVKLDKVEMTI